MKTSAPESTRSRAELWRVIAGLIIFGAAFGYLEAAVVTYLRTIYTPLRLHFYPGTGSQLFPLLTLQQFRLLGQEHVMRLEIEVGREFATLLMLGGAALLAARKPREWVAAFLICFGVWDSTFYLFLKVLVQWPASLFTWDILFLIPVPWTGPVIAPVLVSLSMIASGATLLWREYHNRPVHITRWQWALIVLGGAIVVAAFVWDFRNTANGGNPNPFNWLLFIGGEAIGLAGFAAGLRRPPHLRQDG
jgi:hypothetical protein